MRSTGWRAAPVLLALGVALALGATSRARWAGPCSTTRAGAAACGEGTPTTSSQGRSAPRQPSSASSPTKPVSASVSAASAPPSRVLQATVEEVSDDSERPAAFEREARAIVDLLAAGATQKLAAFVSGDGLLVVKRERLWDDTEDRSLYGAARSSLGSRASSREGVLRTVWRSVNMRLTGKELRGAEFSATVRHYQKLVQASRYGSHREAYSLSMWDHWHAHYLGPGAEGMQCSSSYWYAQFAHEAGRWRLAVLEEATR